MNATQLAAAIRDNLQAGGGGNPDDPTDPFWHQTEIFRYLAEALDKAWIALRIAREDYFMKIATALFAKDKTEIALPNDFAELKIIRVTDADLLDVVFRPLDVSDPLFRRALRADASEVMREYYFDIIGRNTIKVGPKLGRDYNVELHYISRFPRPSKYTTGTVDVTNGSTAVTGTNTLWLGNVSKDWELIVGTVVDPSTTYPVLASAPSTNTALTLVSGYNGATAAGQSYTLSSPVDIDPEHRVAIEAYATMLGFLKGISPSSERADHWKSVYNDAIASSLASVQRRQLQDPEFVRTYDPWELI